MLKNRLVWNKRLKHLVHMADHHHKTFIYGLNQLSKLDRLYGETFEDGPGLGSETIRGNVENAEQQDDENAAEIKEAIKDAEKVVKNKDNARELNRLIPKLKNMLANGRCAKWAAELYGEVEWETFVIKRLKTGDDLPLPPLKGGVPFARLKQYFLKRAMGLQDQISEICMEMHLQSKGENKTAKEVGKRSRQLFRAGEGIAGNLFPPSASPDPNEAFEVYKSALEAGAEAVEAVNLSDELQRINRRRNANDNLQENTAEGRERSNTDKWARRLWMMFKVVSSIALIFTVCNTVTDMMSYCEVANNNQQDAAGNPTTTRLSCESWWPWQRDAIATDCACDPPPDGEGGPCEDVDGKQTNCGGLATCSNFVKSETCAGHYTYTWTSCGIECALLKLFQSLGDMMEKAASVPGKVLELCMKYLGLFGGLVFVLVILYLVFFRK